MTLISRIIAPDTLAGEIKIPEHQIVANVAELLRGAPGVTVAAIVAAYDLTASEQQELQDIVDEFQLGNISRELIHDVFLMGVKGQYTEQQVRNRLGIS